MYVHVRCYQQPHPMIVYLKNQNHFVSDVQTKEWDILPRMCFLVIQPSDIWDISRSHCYTTQSAEECCLVLPRILL